LASASTSYTRTAQSCEAAFIPEFRELLDHIAVELAEEYVRLMEAAAKVATDGQQAEEERV
jgi:hypothetical protein